MILKQKFMKDFFDAHECDKAITTGELDLVTGTLMLRDLLEYVRKDIETLDQDGKLKLDDAIKKLDKVNKDEKENIKARFPAPEDSEEERTLKYKMLVEDHRRYKKELFFIQDLAYGKGWFDQQA